MVARVREWEKAGDERMWRIIVSPGRRRSHGPEGPYSRPGRSNGKRSWGRGSNGSLSTTTTPTTRMRICWCEASIESGKALLIDRDYVRNGIRARSQEIASRELGQRLEPEMLRARGETIDKERWTEIDRALQRRMNGDRVADYRGLVPYNDAARVRAEQEMQRLQFLEGLGLARKTGSLAWELSPDHERELRSRQLAMDVIKRQAEANRVRSLNELADERDVVIANSVTRGGYQGRFVGYFEDAEGRRYAGLQRGHCGNSDTHRSQGSQSGSGVRRAAARRGMGHHRRARSQSRAREELRRWLSNVRIDRAVPH